MNFIHYSRNNDTITNENFIKPNFQILPKSDKRHNFNPPCVLFLSLQNPDGNSDWYDRCVENIDSSEEWVTGTKNIYKIDINKNNIYVIDNNKKLSDFFSKYSVLKYNSVDKKTPYDIINTNQYNKLINNITFILDYLDNVSSKKKEFIKDEKNIIELAKKRNNMILPTITNGKFNKSPNKQNNDFIVDVFRLLKKLYDDLGKHSMYEKNKLVSYIEYIDYQKIKLDGYDGVYFSKKIIQNIDKHKFHIQNSIFRNFIVNTNNYIDNNIKNNIEYEISEYIKWLEIDTLMLWNLDFIFL